MTLALSNTQAPGTPADVNFSEFSEPTLNDSGQVAFQAMLTGAGVSSTNDVGIWRAAPGDVVLVAREGNPAPGTPAGVSFSGSQFPLLNALGQVAFASAVSGTGVTTSNDSGIWAGAPGAIQLAAREGSAATGTGGASYGVPFLSAFNNSGQVAFGGSLTGTGVTSTNNAGIWRGAPGALQLAVRKGDAAPGTGPGATFLGFGSSLGLNDAGQVAFFAALTLSDHGIWRGAPQVQQLVARIGDPAPGTPAGVEFGSLSSFANFATLNEAGQTAFQGSLVGAGVDATNDLGIWRWSPGAFQLVARTGNSAPGTPAGVAFSNLRAPVLNEAGQVAFSSNLIGAGLSIDAGIWRGEPGAVQLIARTGRAVPGAAAGVTFASFSNLSLNDSGQVAFFSSLQGTGVVEENNAGIYLADAEELVQIVREGQSLAGSTVANLPTLPLVGPFNSFSQYVFRATLADGRKGVFLFTPEVRWRRNFGGSWDQATNWTASIPPGAPHDVRIDPAGNVTVLGPTGSVTVNTLSIGGGTGIATLQLQQGGSITVPFGITLQQTGVLTGDGSVSGLLTNFGTVIADNVTIQNGSLINRGIVTGNGRINGVLINQVDGEVRVASDQHLRIVETVPHLNSGQVEVLGGQLEFHGLLTNPGRVLARNALLRFNGGLTNSTGLILLSFGTSDIFGDIENDGRGQIVITGGSNATFYDNVINNGELRVSAGSTAVYVGDVSGTGDFTGTGTNFFEGTFGPGNSPGAVDFEGDFVLAASGTLGMEIGGKEPGVSYDQLHVAGLLKADGTMNVSLLDGFQPSAGDSFSLLSFGELDAWFDNVSLPPLAGDQFWSELRSSDGYQITVVPEPTALFLAVLALGMITSRRRCRIAQ